MCSLPAHNPCVPFLTLIPGGVKVGKKFIVRGLMPLGANRFTIDFQCGNQWMKDDIAFHLSVRPSECTIVRNDYQCCRWGPEERHGSCPIFRGQPYEIEIDVDYNRFSVRINGNHFCEFVYRIPIQRISHIYIAGETILHYVDFNGSKPHFPHKPHKPRPGPHHHYHHHNHEHHIMGKK